MCLLRRARVEETPARPRWSLKTLCVCMRQGEKVGFENDRQPSSKPRLARGARYAGPVCLHDTSFGGPHPCRPCSPPSLAAMIARLLTAAAQNTAWTFTATTQPRAQLIQAQLRRTTGWSLSLALCFARLDTRFADNKRSRPAQANGAATWQIPTTYETKRTAGAWSSTSASRINVLGAVAILSRTGA